MTATDSTNTVRWAAKELSSLFPGPFLGDKLAPAGYHLQPVTGVSVDSRLVQPGDLFVALAGDPGQRFKTHARSVADGHDYVAHALERGASAALVSRLQDVDLPQYQTIETYNGLWELGAAARARLAGPIIAITGSSGKTTAKSFLAQALGAFAPPGSFNNHIGVPLSLANAWSQAPAWVFEIGTSNAGEIAPLTAMVKPDLGILLNVQNAHIENFPSRQALIEEKRQIFSTLPADGLRVVHDELGMAGYQFGHRPTSHAQIKELQGDRLSLSLFGEVVSARVPGGGDHRALTLSACLLAMKLLGFSLEAGLGLPAQAVPSGRGNSHMAAGIEVVDDSYNANPSSMQEALSVFLADNHSASGRSFAVVGDMRELGEEGPQAHEKLLERLAHEPALHGIVVVGEQMNQALAKLESGDLPDMLGPRLLGRFPETNDKLTDLLVDTLRAGDRVLVKGSNGIFWTNGFVDGLLARLG